MASTPKVGATFAVVVGISDYQDSDIPDLQFADKDAEAFADFLRSRAGGALDQEHLTLLTNEKASFGRVTEALEALIELIKKGDHVIIFFAGHGDVESRIHSQPGYLLCYDSPSKIYSKSTYSLTRLKQVIETLSLDNLAKVTLITDACHAGKLSGSKIGGAQLVNANLAVQQNKEVNILSCQAGEFSLAGEQWGGGRGCFSYHLVEGLYGLADKNADAVVTISEMERYLAQHVTKETAPHVQTPIRVGGENSDPIAKVDSALFSQLKKYKKGELLQFSPTEGCVFEETILAGLSENRLKKTVDAAAWEIYLKFKQALTEKRFLEPEADCAELYYYQMLAIKAFQPLQGFIQRHYAAALQDEAQQAVNSILKINFIEVTKSSVERVRQYRNFPKLLSRTADLVGEKHYMYNALKARQMLFEGLVLYLENYNSEDPEIVKTVMDKYDRSLKYQPDLPLTEYYISICLAQKMNQPDSAYVHALKATRYAETWVLPYTHLAYLYSRMYKRFPEAKQLLEKASEMDSNSLVYWIAYGAYYYYQDNYRESIQAYQKVIDLDPGNTIARINMGAAFIETKQYDEAEELLLQTVQMAPKQVNGRYYLGVLYSRTNRLKDAEYWYLQALERDPKHTNTLNNLALLYLSQNRSDEAEQQYLKLTAIETTRSDIWYNLACINASGGKTEKAIDYLEQALANKMNDYDLIQQDTWLDPIRASENFKTLLKKYFPEKY
jgi:protein O-mannosyl-transferase